MFTSYIRSLTVKNQYKYRAWTPCGISSCYYILSHAFLTYHINKSLYIYIYIYHM
jgi:hypothetical protein